MREINIILTNKCNLNCAYCYEKIKGSEVMTEKIGVQAIDYFINNIDNTKSVNINYHGGEPLLEYELMKYLTNYAKERLKNLSIKPKFTFATNGTLITEEMVDFFIENEFRITISIDGKKEVHDKHRINHLGVGSFKDSIKGAELLKRKGANFRIRMTVTKENASKMAESVKWFLDEGYTGIDTCPDFFQEWGDEFEDLKKNYKIIKDIYANDETRKFSFGLFDGKFPSFITEGGRTYCSGGYDYFAVDADGQLYPCSYVLGIEKFQFGSTEQGVLEDKRSQTIKELFKKDYKKCNECDIKYFCHGKKCGFLNCVLTNYVNVPSEFLCEHERFLHSLLRELVEEMFNNNDIRLMSFLNVAKEKKVRPTKFIERYLYELR